MLLYLFDYLSQYYSGFNVFQYLTLRIILAALTALFTSLILGPYIIQKLKDANMYQSVRDDGPESHINMVVQKFCYNLFPNTDLSNNINLIAANRIPLSVSNEFNVPVSKKDQKEKKQEEHLIYLN